MIRSASTTVKVTQAPTPPPVFKTLADAAAALKSGEWYQLPAKNSLKNVLMTQATLAAAPFNWSSSTISAFWGVEGPESLVYDWNGGAVGQGKFYVWGGGHSNYGGNEIYAFDLGTWTWSRVNNPSAYVALPCGYATSNGSCKTTDGTPVSVHSYQGIEVIPTTGKMWVGGGAAFSVNGGFTNQSAQFDFTTLKWQMLPNLPWSNGIVSVWDAASEKLLLVPGTGGERSGAFATFNPKTNQYENVSSGNWTVNGVGALDPVSRKLVVEADWGDSNKNTVYVFNLSGIDLKNSTGAVDWSRFTYQKTTLNGAEGYPPIKAYPGFVYDPVKKLFVIWDGGSDVWTLNPVDFSWKKVATINAGPTRNSLSQGVYSRWRYLADYGVFIAYDNLNQNPWIFKL